MKLGLENWSTDGLRAQGSGLRLWFKPGLASVDRAVARVRMDAFQPERIGQRIALAGIAASALLATLNIAVGLYARSTSVVATGVEFAGDVLASTVVYVGMVVAGKPADSNHPYGHGRVETLAAFAVGMILVAGGAGICWTSLQAIGSRTRRRARRQSRRSSSRSSSAA